MADLSLRGYHVTLVCPLRIGGKKGCQKNWMQAGKIPARSALHQTQGMLSSGADAPSVNVSKHVKQIKAAWF